MVTEDTHILKICARRLGSRSLEIGQIRGITQLQFC